MTLLIASLIKASVVLALALGATLLLRRRSAAVRHGILALAIVCAILMPALEWVLPSMPVVPWGREATVESSGLSLESGVADVDVETTVVAPTPTGVSWMSVLAGLWGFGSLIALAGLSIGFLRLARLRRRCTPVSGVRQTQTLALARECGVRRPVALFHSSDHTQPVTYGVLTPGIVLPADAEHWSDERWHIVLRHELAHIARGDAAVQITSEVLRILQPVNPLVWIACRRLRQESEYACDDQVLRGGVPPIDYATHLLDIARDLSDRHVAIAAAPAIAHPSTLERRIVAMLQATTNRSPLTRRGWIAAAAAALSISLPIAATGLAQAPPAAPRIAPATAPLTAPTSAPLTAPLTAPFAAPTPAPREAPAQTASITGQVVDQTGGTIPGVTVTLTDQQTAQASTAMTDPAGRFSFRDLPSAAYTLTGGLPGFTSFNLSFTLTPGATFTPRLELAVGTLSESVWVTCGPTEFPLLRAFFPVLEARQSTGTPIRVGGQVRPPKKIRDVKPTCPAGLATDEVRVSLKGRIDESGTMADVALDDSTPGNAPPAEFVTAALDAVRQWQFTPTELNRQPIAIEIRVNLTFGPR